MLDSAMAAWMASPGHREAILVPAYKFVNLGLAWREDGWGYRFHAVQLFEGDYVGYRAPPAIEYGGRLVLAGSRAVGGWVPPTVPLLPYEVPITKPYSRAASVSQCAR